MIRFPLDSINGGNGNDDDRRILQPDSSTLAGPGDGAQTSALQTIGDQEGGQTQGQAAPQSEGERELVTLFDSELGQSEKCCDGFVSTLLEEYSRRELLLTQQFAGLVETLTTSYESRLRAIEQQFFVFQQEILRQFQFIVTELFIRIDYTAGGQAALNQLAAQAGCPDHAGDSDRVSGNFNVLVEGGDINIYQGRSPAPELPRDNGSAAFSPTPSVSAGGDFELDLTIQQQQQQQQQQTQDQPATLATPPVTQTPLSTCPVCGNTGGIKIDTSDLMAPDGPVKTVAKAIADSPPSWVDAEWSNPLAWRAARKQAPWNDEANLWVNEIIPKMRAAHSFDEAVDLTPHKGIKDTEIETPQEPEVK